jgi:hypothetical protein
MQGVEFNAGFVVDLGDRSLEGRDHFGAVLAYGKGRDDDNNALSGAFLLLVIIHSVVR